MPAGLDYTMCALSYLYLLRRPYACLSTSCTGGCPTSLFVKNAFLHGALTETLYCSQSVDFVDPTHPDLVYKLNNPPYGLKQAHCALYNQIASYLLSLCFYEAKSNTSLFIYQRDSDMMYLLLYVNDIVLTISGPALLHHIIFALQCGFAMKNFGQFHHFLGHRCRCPSRWPVP